MKILSKLLENKLIFIETVLDQEGRQDFELVHRENILAVSNFKKACDSGRGGILFATATGSLASSISLTDHYSRCVVVFGVPQETKLSRSLKARLSYFQETCGVDADQYLTEDAMRYVGKCVSNVMSSSDKDYTMVILLDSRF